MLPVVQLPDVLSDVSAPNAGVTLDTHVVPQCKHHLRTATKMGREVYMEVCMSPREGGSSMCRPLVPHYTRSLTTLWWPNLLDLDCQLPGRREHKGLRLPQLNVHLLQSRDGKCGRFPGARLGPASRYDLH